MLVRVVRVLMGISVVGCIRSIGLIGEGGYWRLTWQEC